MADTKRSRTASFNISPEKWEAFKKKATQEEKNASWVLLDFIDRYLEGSEGEGETSSVLREKVARLEGQVELLMGLQEEVREIKEWQSRIRMEAAQQQRAIAELLSTPPLLSEKNVP